VFFKGSRYEQVPDAQMTIPGGRAVSYKRIRFIPGTAAAGEHTVTQGERLDLIAQQYLRNPECFWRVCDANLSMLPDELDATPGRTILIPSDQ